MTATHLYARSWADPRAIFDGLTDDYDRYRPRYDGGALKGMLAWTGAVGTLVDLGCGTGILTRALRPLLPGAAIIGAEPGTDMLAAAAATSDPALDLRWLNCRAEALPFARASLDLITVGQAAHWFDRPRFYDECARVLRPGGVLALLYNNRVRGSAVDRAQETFLSEVSPGYTRAYRDFDAVAELEAHPGTRDVTGQRVPWDWVRSVADYIGYLRSTSHYKVACRHRPEAEVIARASAQFAPHADEVGNLTVPYETIATLARF